MSSWLNATTVTSQMRCSDCNLGAMQNSLNSPFGYDDQMLANFTALTSSCAMSSYPVTSPSAYAISTLSATAPASNATATPTPICRATYTTTKDDTFRGIALAQNISTYLLARANNLDIRSKTLIPGTLLCVPTTCKVYEVVSGDTCNSIIGSSNITAGQLIAWNPQINSQCSNLQETPWVLCLRFVSKSRLWVQNTNTT